MQRNFQQAGYGFANVPALIGCTLTAMYNGTAATDTLAAFPTRLAPLVITQGAGDAPDSVRILASGKTSYAIPIRMTAPGYDPANAATRDKFSVGSSRSVEGPKATVPGDLMVAVTGGDQVCEMFQVTSDPASGTFVDRADNAGKWNKVGFPTRTYGDGNYLVNLGTMLDQTYSVAAGDNGGLLMRTFRLATDATPSYEGPVEVFPGIVNLQAYYGKGVAGTGVVTSWSVDTPATNADWKTVFALRLALVARSAQYEKEEVTAVNPLWDVGAVIAVAGSATCGTSKCVNLKVDHLADWKHYRYKVFDTVIPLRNMLWTE
jgi:type IV pilus assembly protein PilW